MAPVAYAERAANGPLVKRERRRSKRHAVALPVVVIRASDDRAKHGMLIDVSETGARAAIDADLFIGECVELQVVAGIRVSGIVRHKRFSTYGLEFVQT